MDIQVKTFADILAVDIPEGWLEYKAIFTFDGGGVGTFGDYAPSADEFMHQLIDRRGEAIKHFDEIQERHKENGYTEVQLKTRKYNIWLGRHKKNLVV